MVDFEKKITNSNKFRQAAIHFLNYGYYCLYPIGTAEYTKFWDEEKRRCLEGYTAEDGDYITGYNYFYLNYCPIDRIVYEKRKDRFGVEKEIRTRKTEFPDFYDYDVYFFDSVEEAEQEGKHLCVLKSRRKGYSYKCASMACRNYYIIPNSKSYIYASDKEYLLGDGTFTKVVGYMSFIDKHTAFAKKKSINKTLHKRAGFFTKDEFGNEVEMGYKSEIIGASLKDDPSKVRGKAGKLILFEEGGSFSELSAAWAIARPSVELDGIAFGLMLVFGTGGDTKGNNFVGLKDMFYHPDGYNCLSFPNIWDEYSTDNCGFFCPQYTNLANRDDKGNRMYMDEDGNTYRKKALEYILSLRKQVIENASNSETVDRYVAENCLTPQEACLDFRGNIFPKKELQEHLARIRTNTALKNFKQVGDLVWNETGGVKWIMKKTGDITHYPLQKDDDPHGSIVIWEHPVKDAPVGLYIAGIDSYDYDQSSTTSLGSCFIYKRFQKFELYYDLIVAEYTGRPDTAEEFYENVRKLLIYYNARAMYENLNKGIFAYFTTKHCDYLLADQPDIITDVVGNTKVLRKKGCHMNKLIKAWGEGLIKDWLNEEQAPGKKNLTNIFSEPLLEELIMYNDTINADRCVIKDTLITTKRGNVPVLEINIGDEVLTHTGDYNKVTWVDNHYHKGNIVSLKCLGDYLILNCTDNHPIYIKYTNFKSHKFRNLNSLSTDFLRADLLNKKYLFALLPKRKNLLKINLSEEILYVLGWIMADGHCYRYSDEVKITYLANQLLCAKQCKKFIENFDDSVKCVIKKDIKSNCYKLVTFSKKLHDLAVYFGCETNNKKINYEIYNKYYNLISFILGWLEGSGHLSYNINCNECVRNSIEISTVNEELIRQCRLILIDNDIYSAIRKVKSKKGYKTQYNLLIYNEYVKKLLNHYRSKNNQCALIVSYKFKLFNVNKNTSRVLKDLDGFWVPIKLLNIYETNEIVYNFEVQNDHTYVANGIVTHNCMALLQLMIYREELHNVVIKSHEQENKKRMLFDGPIFAQNWEDEKPNSILDNNVYTFNNL